MKGNDWLMEHEHDCFDRISDMNTHFDLPIALESTTQPSQIKKKGA